jgi:hypothetical protein
MSQKKVKQYRKTAEKTAKTVALEIAKSQITDIIKAPFIVRWRFCKAILFPKKVKVNNVDVMENRKKSYGIVGDTINAGQ